MGCAPTTSSRSKGSITASFFVGSDLEENQIAIFYTGAMAQARNYSLEDQGLADSQIVLISPNDPAGDAQVCPGMPPAWHRICL